MTARTANPMSKSEHIALLSRTVHLLELAAADLERCPTHGGVSGVHDLDAHLVRTMAARARDDWAALLDEAARDAHPAGSARAVA